MLLLCVRLGISRERRCGHHAAETPLHACTAARVQRYHSGSKEGFCRHIISQTIRKLAAFTRIPAIGMAADCVDAPRRNVKADSAAPWQCAPPLDRVKVVSVRAAWHES